MEKERKKAITEAYERYPENSKLHRDMRATFIYRMQVIEYSRLAEKQRERKRLFSAVVFISYIISLSLLIALLIKNF